MWPGILIFDRDSPSLKDVRNKVRACAGRWPRVERFVPSASCPWTSAAPHGLALAPPVGWALAKGLPEKLGQMGLVGEPDVQGDFGQPSRTGQHQVAGFLEPPPHDGGMRRFS